MKRFRLQHTPPRCVEVTCRRFVFVVARHTLCFFASSSSSRCFQRPLKRQKRWTAHEKGMRWDEWSSIIIQSAPSSSRNRDIKPKKKERNERKTQNRNKSERERERGNLNIYTLSINSDFLPRSSRYNSSSMWFSGGGFSVGPGETRAERRGRDEYAAWEVTSVHESRKTHKHSKFRVIRAHMYRFNNTHTKMLLWWRLLAGDWMTFERSCLVVLLPLKTKTLTSRRAAGKM